MASSSMERLQFYLSRLRCPAFLQQQHADEQQQQQSVLSSAFRKTLLLWLFAVYHSPSARLVDDEGWTRHEPSPPELLQWLRLMGAQDGSALVDGAMSLENACAQLMLVVECVHGRVLLHERGEQAILSESLQLMDDIATHVESFFDARCEIFPVSIQLSASDNGSRLPYDPKQQLERDIEFIDQQTRGLETRVEAARSRLDALTGSAMGTDPSDAKALSGELGTRLQEAMLLMEKASLALAEDATVSTYKNDASRSALVGLGQAAAEACERIDSVLAFFENAELSARLSRDGRSLRKAHEVAEHCQDVVNRIAPDLQEQLSALERAIALTDAARM